MRDISIVLHDVSAQKLGFAGWVERVLGWPARVLAARETLAMLGELSEREWQDIEPGRSDLTGGAEFVGDDDPADRRARARAIRAWYGHGAQAA